MSMMMGKEGRHHPIEGRRGGKEPSLEGECRESALER
jgi:hypothetical protein